MRAGQLGPCADRERHNRTTGLLYAWIVPGTAIVNQFYVYAVDAAFGPFYLTFSSRAAG